MEIALEFTGALVRIYYSKKKARDSRSDLGAPSGERYRQRPIPGEFYSMFSRKGHVFRRRHARDAVDFVRRG